MEQTEPRVGTGVWIRKDGKVLMGLRNGKYGAGTWCPPGGHINMFETMIDCVRRETREEASIEIENIKFINALENIWREIGTHYITPFFVADWKSGEPIPQPEEFDRWEWFAWEGLPEPLFRPAQIFVDSGINPLLK